MLSMRLIMRRRFWDLQHYLSLSNTFYSASSWTVCFSKLQPQKKYIFLCPDKHFLTAGLVNSSYYFCVLCYKQCRWPSLVILLHQSSFRFVCFCLDLFSIKGLIDVFFCSHPGWRKLSTIMNWVKSSMSSNAVSILRGDACLFSSWQNTSLFYAMCIW